MEFKIDWSGRAFDYSENEIAAVVDVMRGGDPLTQGAHLQRFEEKFRRYVGVDNAFAVANCTNAIDLVALLADIDEGDEVVMPAHTFCASAIPFLRRGAVLRWADIDPDTWVASRETIERAVTDRTKLIAVVHLYGLMPDMDPIMDLARERGIPVMEDVAQAIGARDADRPAGSLGDFAVFSFQGQKNLTTLGEGGMLVVRDPELAEKVPGLRHNGVRGYERRDDRYWVPAMSNVDVDVAGEMPFNFCLGEAQCALGAEILDRLDDMNAVRASRAAKFRAAVADHDELVFQQIGADKVSSHHLLPARYDSANGTTRDDLISRMAFEHGVKVIVQYYPLYRYPLFKVAGFGEADCPETDRYFDRMVSFPFHLWMSDEDFDYMTERAIDTLQAIRDGR